MMNSVNDGKFAFLAVIQPLDWPRADLPRLDDISSHASLSPVSTSESIEGRVGGWTDLLLFGDVIGAFLASLLGLRPGLDLVVDDAVTDGAIRLLVLNSP